MRGGEFFIRHLTIFGKESHLLVDLVGGEEGIRHYSAPEIVWLLRFRISHQHLSLLNHEFFG
jgi:hypothetical protein